MQTLYDVLGLNRLATQEQVNQAYKQNLESLTSAQNSASVDQNAIRAMAIKEAYSVLSSLPRRNAYDASLRVKEQGTYQIIEKPSTPWIKITIVILAIAACFFYYKHQQNKAQKERIELDIQQAKALVERAENELLAEQARLEQIRIHAQRQAEYRSQTEMNAARYEGRYISERNRRFDEQIERDRRRDAQQAAADAATEERQAKAKSANEAAAMRRALQTPIGQSDYYRRPTGATIQNK